MFKKIWDINLLIKMGVFYIEKWYWLCGVEIYSMYSIVCVI